MPRRADGTPDCVLEVRPQTAMAAGDLARAELPDRIEHGARLLL